MKVLKTRGVCRTKEPREHIQSATYRAAVSRSAVHIAGAVDPRRQIRLTPIEHGRMQRPHRHAQ